MGTDIRKGVVLAPAGSHRASIYSYLNQRDYFLAPPQGTNTKWVRLWAIWPDLEPSQGASANDRWLELDEQIHQAISDGLVVILTAFLYPTWSNVATRAADGVPASDDHATFYIPDDLGPSGAWASFIERLIIRYNPLNPASGGTYIQNLELMNEPNLQMRPKAGRAAKIAKMMQTALTVKSRNKLDNFWPVLLAPGSSDTRESNTVWEPYDKFTTNLLNELDALNASSPGRWFGWSHHNHRDIELDAGMGNAPPYGQAGNPQSSAAMVRSLLKNRWYGWNSTSSADPKVLLTEGGARLDVVRDYWFTVGGTPSPDTVRNKQRELLERNYNRMRNTSDGTGIALLMWHLFTSDYTYDTGLRDAYVYARQDQIV
jgi:hypothetical protein